MIYYHGSPFGDIINIEPKISNHNESYVYLSNNEVISTFYMVNVNFYTYGFEENCDTPVYTEHYPNALKDIYSGKSGYLYSCEINEELKNPTNIKGVVVSDNIVTPDLSIRIDDIYEKLMYYVENNRLRLKLYNDLTNKEYKNIENQIENEIVENSLLISNSDYSTFIRIRFPEVWKRVASR